METILEIRCYNQRHQRTWSYSNILANLAKERSSAHPDVLRMMGRLIEQTDAPEKFKHILESILSHPHSSMVRKKKHVVIQYMSHPPLKCVLSIIKPNFYWAPLPPLLRARAWRSLSTLRRKGDSGRVERARVEPPEQTGGNWAGHSITKEWHNCSKSDPKVWYKVFFVWYLYIVYIYIYSSALHSFLDTCRGKASQSASWLRVFALATKEDAGCTLN